jgi:spermidine synthase
VLRRAGDRFEVISNGVFLMDTSDGRSERLLVRTAVERHHGPTTLLIGGLGVGFSLAEAVQIESLERIVVAEIEPALVDWHHRFLTGVTGTALADPRVEVTVGDVAALLASWPETYDVICLDTDNGPDWTVTEANRGLYAADGLRRTVGALRPGGVLAYWSAHPVDAFESLLREHLTGVSRHDVPVALDRAAPDIVYLGQRPHGS